MATTYTKQTVFAKGWLLLSPVHLSEVSDQDEDCHILPRHNMGWRWLQANIALARFLGWLGAGNGQVGLGWALWGVEEIDGYDVLVPEDEA